MLPHSPTPPNPSIGQAGAAINPVNKCLHWKSPKFGFPDPPHSHPKPPNFDEMRNGEIGLTANFALPNPEDCSGFETKCRLHALRTKQGRLFDATRLIWRPALSMPSLNLYVSWRSNRTSGRWDDGKKMLRWWENWYAWLIVEGKKREWVTSNERVLRWGLNEEAAGFLSSSHDSRPFRATNADEA